MNKGKLDHSQEVLAQEVIVLRELVELKNQENMQMCSTITSLRMQLKEAESQWQKRELELVEHCTVLESDYRKYKEEYGRICEVLKSKINDTINRTSDPF